MAGPLMQQAGILAAKKAASYDPDAQAIIDRMIPEPPTELKERINNLVLGLKNPALWSSAGALWYGTDSLQVYNGAQNSQSALLDWAYNDTATLHGNFSFSAGVGVAPPVGQGLIANYLRTRYTPKTRTHWSDNDSSVTFISTRALTATVAMNFLGCGNSVPPNQGLVIGHTSAQTRGYIAYGSYAYNAADARQAGKIVTLSKKGNDRVLIINGVSGTPVTGAGSTAAYTGDIALGGSRGSADTGVSSPGDLGYGLFHAGRAITAAEQIMLGSLYDAYVAS